MHEILDDYRPDFSPGDWSERDRHFLEAFATNPDGIVSVLQESSSGNYRRAVFARQPGVRYRSLKFC